jgi:ABC-type amino acid transport substrate-binding protein
MIFMRKQEEEVDALGAPRAPEPPRNEAADATASRTEADALDDPAALIRSRNQTELALSAGIQQSAISMALRWAESKGQKGRPISRQAALSLAKVLCPDGHQVKPFADKLFQRFNPPGRKLRSVDLAKIGSVADLVRMGQRIRVAYVESAPFVTKDGPNYRGFAFDVWRHLASLMKIDEDPRHPAVDFRNMGDVLAERGCDIIVTALLPTFGRRAFMSFSRPLPYLGIPLILLR